jgi:hypothetical protein
MASPVSDDRQAGSSAFHCAADTRYSSSASRVAALRRSSREIVDGSRPSLRAISRTQTSCARGIASCSSSGNGRYWPLGSVNSLVDIPTPCRNRWAPTAGGTPTVSAAHSELKPVVTSPELAFDAALGCRCPRRDHRGSVSHPAGPRGMWVSCCVLNAGTSSTSTEPRSSTSRTSNAEKREVC